MFATAKGMQGQAGLAIPAQEDQLITDLVAQLTLVLAAPAMQVLADQDTTVPVERHTMALVARLIAAQAALHMMVLVALLTLVLAAPAMQGQVVLVMQGQEELAEAAPQCAVEDVDQTFNHA